MDKPPESPVEQPPEPPAEAKPERKNLRSDIIFGLIGPLFVLIVDPIVFKAGNHSCADNYSFLGHYSLMAYLAIGTGLVTLLIWLVRGSKLTVGAAPVAGILLTGGVLSFLLGIPLIPLSIIGIVYIVGPLGLMPLFTGAAFIRNGVRAFRQFREKTTSGRKLVWVAAMILAPVLTLGIPALANWQAARVLQDATQAVVDSQQGGGYDLALNRLRLIDAMCLTLCRPMLQVQIQRAWVDSKYANTDFLYNIYTEVTGAHLYNCNND